MKKLFTVTNTNLTTAFALLAGVALGAVFWIASVPLAQAAERTNETPDAMIQEGLHGTTIAQASKPQLKAAICGAVRKHRADSALIVRTASGARSEFRKEIWCEAMRCLRQEFGMDCGSVASTVKKWIDADPANSDQIVESISECVGCHDELQSSRGGGEGNFTNPPTNINAPPGSVGGGAGGNVCIVCHNGAEKQIACSDLDSYLKSHPGDTAGPCVLTTTTNP